MTHYTMLVAVEDGKDLEPIMLPYKEYGWGADDEGLENYLKFEIKYLAADFRKEARAILREVADGHDDPELAEKYQSYFDNGDYTDIFSDWSGGELREGNWGQWHNPNDRWDWYTVGGRWTGSLVTKNGGKTDIVSAADLDIEATLEHLKTSSGEAFTWGHIDLDGEWDEKAKMGWWATHSEKDEDYNERFYKFIDEAAEKNIDLYLVDCHI